MANDRTTDQKQPVTFTLEDDPSQILTFDATLAEGHKGTASVTDHPVENGVDFTDHIRRMPNSLTITGVVTDAPLVVERSVNATPANTGGDPNQRAVSAYQFLLVAKDRGKLIRVFTRLRDYRNMAIISLSVPRTAGESRIIRAEIELREILVAVTEQVEAPTPIAPTRRRKSKKGKQAKKKENEKNKEKAKNQSVASRLAGKQLTSFLESGP